MSRPSLLALFISLILSACSSEPRTVEIEIVGSTDVHGAYFAHDYLTGRDSDGGLSRLMTYLKQERARLGDNVIYIDNGDILQGQPTAYYYNFMDTASTHLAAEVLNYMGASVGTIGNHDVETGHKVFDRWIADCDFPVLGANVIDTATGEPYLKPYEIIERDGVKIAVLGMLTPAIPCWLPENLWSGLRFDDIAESSARWIPIIKERENPDVIIGLFHAGQGDTRINGIADNPTDMVAQTVPGFDAIFYGHDHNKECRKVYNEASGDSVLIINCANKAMNASVVTLKVTKDSHGRVLSKSIDGHLEPMSAYQPDADYDQHFEAQTQAISRYIDQKIGTIDSTISTEDALYGPTPFMTLVHRLQMAVADNADLSIAAPLSMSARIEAGDITIRDMFNLYKYENQLYTMRLTGQEVKDLLEMSYDMWINGDGMSFNYDSAYGIDYTVDPTKPKGKRIDILRLSDGRQFSLADDYRVAVNSYRGNGGGDLITLGTGIPKEQLSSRILASTDKDLRYYLIRHISQTGRITPTNSDNWHFVPADWARKNIRGINNSTDSRSH